MRAIIRLKSGESQCISNFQLKAIGNWKWQMANGKLARHAQMPRTFLSYNQAPAGDKESDEATGQAGRATAMDESELRSQLERHHADSYGWALACCAQNRELAEDMLQTAYLKILQGRARYLGQAAFKTWLFAVIRITAAGERRRFWRRWLGLNRYERHREPAVEPPRDDAMDESARLDAFRLALKRLPRRQREVMHL